jgi:hypothetical protein
MSSEQKKNVITNYDGLFTSFGDGHCQGNIVQMQAHFPSLTSNNFKQLTALLASAPCEHRVEWFLPKSQPWKKSQRSAHQHHPLRASGW